MRAGPPVALDRMVAAAYGTMAVQALEAGESGLMTALRDGTYVTVPADTCIQAKSASTSPNSTTPPPTGRSSAVCAANRCTSISRCAVQLC